MSLRSLTNLDYSDRELLLAINRCSGKDGTALAADVAEDLGIRTNGKRTPAGTVSVRFSWMATHKPDCNRDGCKRHYGYIQRIDPLQYGGKRSDPPRWIITEKGHMLMSGKLRKAVDNALDRMDPGEQLLTLRKLTQRAYIDADQTYATAMRREWLHQTNRRPR